MRESQLPLQKADEICLAAESTAAQIKEVGDTASTFTLNEKPTATKRHPIPQKQRLPARGNQILWKLWSNTRSRKVHGRGKTCNECGKANHFAVVCRSRAQPEKTNRHARVKAIDEVDSDEDVEECYVIEDIAAVATTTLDLSLIHI